MRLVLAHATDAAAATAVARWGRAAVLLTPQDLHTCAWRLELDRDGAARASVRVAGAASGTGEARSAVPVTSVLSRLGGVAAAELTRIQAQDRDYAAAELTAFLLAWLDACRCPVLNRPSAGSLNGPAWQPEQWIQAAARCGLAVRPVCRHVERGVEHGSVTGQAADRVSVTVVAGRCFGPAHEATARRLLALSRSAGAPLLVAGLDGTGEHATVLDACAWPDLADPQVADAVSLVLEAG